MEKKSKDFKSYCADIFRLMRKPVVSVLSGHLAFFFLLSAIPIILLIGIAANTFSFSIASFIDFLKVSLPASTSELVIPLFSGKALSINFVFLLISALYLISCGTNAIIMVASNIYNVKSNLYKNIIKSFIITIVLLFLFIFLIIILIVGSKFLLILSELPNMTIISNNSVKIFNFIKWPISIVVIYFTLKVIYVLAPNKSINAKSVTKGSLFTTILWVIFTAIYSLYSMNISPYTTYFGSASSIVVLMIWIYAMAFIFVIGMIINAVEEKHNYVDLEKTLTNIMR